MLATRSVAPCQDCRGAEPGRAPRPVVWGWRAGRRSPTRHPRQ